MGAENLQRFTLAAIQLEQAGGPAVEKTAEAFLADGWFATGDVGMIAPDGTLKIVVRKQTATGCSGTSQAYTSGRLNTEGKLLFGWSSAGTFATFNTVTSTVPVPIPSALAS